MKGDEKLPRESPTWKRVAPAHWLRDSELEDGTFHALVLPPTRCSMASGEPMLMKRSVRKSSELDEIVEAMEFFSGIEKMRLGWKTEREV